MTDITEFVKLLAALATLLTALIGLSEALNLSNGAAQLTTTWAAVDFILPTGARYNKWFFGNEASATAAAPSHLG